MVKRKEESLKVSFYALYVNTKVLVIIETNCFHTNNKGM